MKSKLLLPVIFLALLISNRTYSQVQVRNTHVYNSCVTEYTMGSATEDQYVIIVFTCSSEWTSGVAIEEFSSALVVAGGGGGGKRNDSGGVRGAGGGGAGGVTYINNPANLVVNGFATLDVTVGAGGLGASNPALRGGTGQDSRIDNAHFNNLISKGGGGGGSADPGSIAGDDQREGGDGGSGGGGVSRNIPGGNRLAIGPTNTGFGFNGGNGAGSNNDSPTGGGGGGGSSSVGETPGATQAGEGGNGIVYPVLTQGLVEFVPQGFAAGGGGVGGNSQNLFPRSNRPNGGSAGGVMIGGTGANGSSGANGVVNTGSGGGAGGSLTSNTFSGGNGASGIVILRYDFAKILPVEYLYTKAQFNANNRSNSILWATGKEIENSHFEIERSIGNINDFRVIETVNGMGWADSVTEYNFVDFSLPLHEAVVYYRINQFDFDGKVTMGKVLSVRLPGSQQVGNIWKVYPNPLVGGDRLNIKLTDLKSYNGETISVKIISSTSTAFQVQARSESELNEVLSGLVARVPRGVLMIEIQWGQKVEHFKLLKK